MAKKKSNKRVEQRGRKAAAEIWNAWALAGYPVEGIVIDGTRYKVLDGLGQWFADNARGQEKEALLVKLAESFGVTVEELKADEARWYAAKAGSTK